MRAWLTGVGAMTLASALLFSVVFDLWSRGIVQFPEGRPTFEIVGLPAYALGAAVAMRAGGWRGLLALILLASLWTVMVPFIEPGPDRDFFVRQLWAYGGIALGVLVAAVRPPRLSSAALVGAGVYGIAIAPNGVLGTLIFQGLCQSDRVQVCVDVVHILSLICSVAGGAAAGLVVGGRISVGGTMLLALFLALPSAVVVAHQGWMWQYDGLLSLLEMARSIAAGLALVLAAAIARTTTNRRGMAGQTL